MNSEMNSSSLVKPLALFYLIPPHLSSFELQEDVPDYVQAVVPYFAILVSLEIVIRWFQGLPAIYLNHSISSVSSGLIMQLLSLVVFKTVEVAGYVWIYENWRLFSLPWDSPVTWFIAMIGYDFFFYWFHRWSHEVNLFWAAHQVHHSSEEYNLSTALRQSIFQRFNSFWVYFPLAFFMPPTQYIVHKQFNLLYQFWIHTECVDTLGPLEYILNTPSHHRVHHGRNRYCIDKNYAGVLIIWDRMFGTFQPEKDKVYYGLVHNIDSFNPIWVQLQHYVYLLKKLWSARSVSECFNILFKGPGWSPGKPRLGEPEDVLEVPNDIIPYNPPVPLWVNVYIFFHFTILIVTSSIMGLRKNEIPYLVTLYAVLYFIYSLTTIGMIYDHRSFAPLFEIIRLTILLYVDYTLGFYYSDILLIQGVRVFIIVSVLVWSLVLFKQMKIKHQ